MRCLLISSYDTDTSLLLELLNQENVTVVTTADLGAGVTLASAPWENIDFVVAVFPEYTKERTTSTLLVEVGIALGRGVPTLVFAPPSTRLPSALNGLRYVAASVQSADAVGLNLKVFIRTVRESSSTSAAWSSSEMSRPLSRDESAVFHQRIDLIRSLPQRELTVAFEDFVADVLSRTGAQVERTYSGKLNTAVDLAALIPGEETRLGPLLIEIKNGRLSPSALRKAARQLQTAVFERQSGFGLLVCLSPVNPSLFAGLAPVPFVWIVSADDFVTALEGIPLSRVLLQLRNSAVHRP